MYIYMYTYILRGTVYIYIHMYIYIHIYTCAYICIHICYVVPWYMVPRAEEIKFKIVTTATIPTSRHGISRKS